MLGSLIFGLRVSVSNPMFEVSMMRRHRRRWHTGNDTTGVLPIEVLASNRKVVVQS